MAGLTLFLLICYVTSLVLAVMPPTNLTLVSRNFQHILTWDDPNNEPDIYYKVDYQEDSKAVVSSKSCSNIKSRFCDLTKDFTEVISQYTVLVRSFKDRNFSDVVTTKGFVPLLETSLGPALVNVVSCNYCIEVSIDPPISHLWSETEQCNVTMDSDQVYPLLEYTIHYRQSEAVQRINLNYKGKPTVITQLLPNTNYCVSVDVKTGSNIAPSIPSAEKCVITGPNEVPQGIRLDVIVPVACGFVLFLGILLLLFALDRAGLICNQRSFIPKVLKSFSRSESRYSGSTECTSPAYIVPVEVVSQKLEVDERQNNEEGYQEGGYASRKKLLDSDTSTGDSSGPILSTNSLSLESSGQMTGSSDEERISTNHQIGLDMITDSDGSFSPIPANALQSSSDVPLNNSGVFNINFNSICIGSTVDALTGLKNGGSLIEESKREPDMNSGQAELSLSGDLILCTSNIFVDLNPTTTDYVTKNHVTENHEEDLSDHGDPDRVVSGYMRR